MSHGTKTTVVSDQSFVVKLVDSVCCNSLGLCSLVISDLVGDGFSP